MFEEPPKTKYNVLSLGAGVQSSCLALMATHGEITPLPDFAVFADVGAEPTEVYQWLELLKKLIKSSPSPFPIYTVGRGNLTRDSLTVRKATKGKYKGEDKVRRIIPTFGLLPSGEKVAAMGRSCTADYKVKPVENKMKELCGIKRGQKEITVTQWMGISWDEKQRMKDAKQAWNQHRFPLIEKRMNRHHCLEWMKGKGYPEPPRSACYYCPFHSDAEWRRMRDEDPEHFQKAIKFDQEIREKHRLFNTSLNMEVYLHNSCKPLSEIDFDNDQDKGQEVWDFMSECDGLCGV